MLIKIIEHQWDDEELLNNQDLQTKFETTTDKRNFIVTSGSHAVCT